MRLLNGYTFTLALIVFLFAMSSLYLDVSPLSWAKSFFDDDAVVHVETRSDVRVHDGATIERTFDAREGQRLDLDMQTGADITISGWDNDEVEVIIMGADDDVEFDFDERSSGLRIRSEYTHRGNHSGDIDVEVRVPHTFDINIETMGGDVSIAAVEGRFEGRTMGGDLTLDKVRGDVDMTTMGGDVDVSDAELDGSLKTMGGDVTMDDVTGSVNSTTMGGDVEYSNVRSGRNADEVRIKTMGGDIVLDEALAGANVHTMGGDIEANRVGEFLKAKTMGGDITIDAIDGWIEANTMGGDIEVTMVGDADAGDRHVELISRGGDIELTVPADLSMSLDLEIAFTRGSGDDYSIQSDFDIEIEKSGRWEYGDGDARKYIESTSSLNGGDHRVRIKTVNGNIILRKGR